MWVLVPDAQVVPLPYTFSSLIVHQLPVFTPCWTTRTNLAFVGAKPTSIPSTALSPQATGVKVVPSTEVDTAISGGVS